MQKRVEQHGKGRSGLDRHAWVTLAEQALYQLVEGSLAVPHIEVEARLFDSGTTVAGGRKLTFYPHILDEARNNLLSGGNIESRVHVTKGAATAELYVPTSVHKQQASPARVRYVDL
jgi:hypothetical protein